MACTSFASDNKTIFFLHPHVKADFRPLTRHFWHLWQNVLWPLGRLLIYWLILFAYLRLWFFALNRPLLAAADVSFQEILSTFFHALPLDLSMAAELTVIPWFLALGRMLLSSSIPALLERGYVLFMTFIYTLIALGETALYPEWKTKLTYRALVVFRRPGELFRITSFAHIFVMSTICLLSTFLLYLLYKKFFAFQVDRKQNPAFQPSTSASPAPRLHRYSKIFATILTGLFLWLTIPSIGLIYLARGSFKPIPISLATVYFSQKQLLNDAAANAGWHLAFNLISCSDFLDNENPMTFMDKTIAAKTTKSLHEPMTQLSGQNGRAYTPSSILLEDFSNPSPLKPNVVFIILESWSADLVESLGGQKGITPNFAELEKEGISFSQFYANGNRSQQGMASIFAGFPALPLVTVTDDLARVAHLPKFAARFNEAGYKTSFLYGGQLDYGNIKALLLQSGFTTIREDGAFSHDLPHCNMGIHDGPMFDELLRHLDGEQSPFAAGLFTLSSHSPYDVPRLDSFHFEGLAADYVKSAMYTDQELGRFFREAKKHPWYDNTLFVVVADHSHPSYKDFANWDPRYRKIPFVLVGNVIKPEWRGKKINRIGSQVDIPVTLLNQLKMPSSGFQWSKDMFDKRNREFAYYELGYGFGWVTTQGEYVFDKEIGGTRLTHGDKRLIPELAQQGMSYAQSVFQAFLDL